MFRYEPSQYLAAHALYLEHEAYFPIIAAVLGGEQDGIVLADREKNPSQIYVEHAFGFAQAFGSPEPAFEHALQRYLVIDKAFHATKVRLYTPHCPSFLQAGKHGSLRSWRQHFELDTTHRGTAGPLMESPVKGLTLAYAKATDVNLIEDTFGVGARFWRTPYDFARYSNAVLAFVGGRPAALCYAAAIAGGRAEIDVFTLPAYRRLGLAKAVVRAFIQRCLAQNLLPLWDCFTNNIPSLALCRSIGFIPLGDPYPFFTICRGRNEQACA